MQRLGAPHRGRQGFNGGARHVVPGVLGRQRPPRSLGVGSEHLTFGAGAKLTLHPICPQHAACTHLGNFLQVGHAVGPEEAKAGREGVHIQASLDSGFHVLEAVGQSVSQLNFLRGTRLLHVVPADADGIESGHVLGRVGKNVTDDTHRRRRRIDERVPHHEFLENVVLNGAGQLIPAHPLFLSRHYVECQNGQHRPIHGHADAHLVQWDTLEEPLHVLDAVDGHTCFAHVSLNAGVVAVVTPVGGQIKCHTQSLLSCRQISAVKGVAFLCR